MRYEDSGPLEQGGLGGLGVLRGALGCLRGGLVGVGAGGQIMLAGIKAKYSLSKCPSQPRLSNLPRAL